MINSMNIKSVLAVFVAAFIMLGFTSSALAGPKVYVCHKSDNGNERSIRISENAEAAHLAHGDLPGRCGEVVLDEWLDVRCDSTPENGGTFVVSNVSFSDGVAAEIAAIVTGNDCAATQKTVQEANCRLARDYGNPDAQAYVFNCPGLPEEE